MEEYDLPRVGDVSLQLTFDRIDEDFWDHRIKNKEINLVSRQKVFRKIIGIVTQKQGLVGFGFVGFEEFTEESHIVVFFGVGRLNQPVKYDWFADLGRFRNDELSEYGSLKVHNSSSCLNNRTAHHPDLTSKVPQR